MIILCPVSYTHLDVYKRQDQDYAVAEAPPTVRFITVIVSTLVPDSSHPPAIIVMSTHKTFQFLCVIFIFAKILKSGLKILIVR